MRQRQLELFTRSELASMRDPAASRNYSPERDQFRRDHERHRAWGLTQRHARRLMQLRNQGDPWAVAISEAGGWQARSAISVFEPAGDGPPPSRASGRSSSSGRGLAPRGGRPNAQASPAERAACAPRTERTERTQPAEQAEQTQPAEQAEQTQPAGQAGQAEQTQPAQPAEQTQPAEQARFADRVGSGRRAVGRQRRAFPAGRASRATRTCRRLSALARARRSGRGRTKPQPSGNRRSGSVNAPRRRTPARAVRDRLSTGTDDDSGRRQLRATTTPGDDNSGRRQLWPPTGRQTRSEPETTTICGRQPFGCRKNKGR
jgi:hypothetical protein